MMWGMFQENLGRLLPALPLHASVCPALPKCLMECLPPFGIWYIAFLFYASLLE